MHQVLRATVACVLLTVACSSGTDNEANFSGNYSGSLTAETFCGTGNLVVTLSQNGTVASGTYTASGWPNSFACNSLNHSGTVTGQISGSSVQLTLKWNTTQANYNLLGTGSATAITGTFTQSYTNAFSNGTFSLTRQ